jgi:DNA-directed RNA polymerase subunit omega
LFYFLSTFTSISRGTKGSEAVIIPLDALIKYDDNVYTITSAMIRRATQIQLAGDEELEANRGKIVSTAIRQLLTEKVRYLIES